MVIYTKRGDSGKTDLFGGKRVKKSTEVVDVLGNLDELNAFLGLAKLSLSASHSKVVSQVQNDLFVVGATVAGLKITNSHKKYLSSRVGEFEGYINSLEKKLPALKNFILPNGCKSSAQLHLARSICRRGERSLVSLSKYIYLIPYLNRLSDYLFILARYENYRRHVKEETVNSDPQL